MMSMVGRPTTAATAGLWLGGVTMIRRRSSATFDRGRRDVDVMDDLETAGLAFGRLSAQFIRDKVVPELDAFRFASTAASAASRRRKRRLPMAATVAALSAADAYGR